MCAGLGCIYTDYYGGCNYHGRSPRPCEEDGYCGYEDYDDYLADKADREYDRIQEEKVLNETF